MLRPNARLLMFAAFSASFLTCRAMPFQGPETATHNLQCVACEPNPSSLVLEFDRAVEVLKRGLAEKWTSRGQYLSAFERTPNTDLRGRPVKEERSLVECTIGSHLRIHENWDEGPPIGVEVHRAIVELTTWRNEARQAATSRTEFPDPDGHPMAFRITPCTAQRNVTISAGVAENMLKTRIEPIYPGDAHVFGTVVLDATISTQGRVRALHVIRGPALLQQAALDAVRRWTYRPYLLNNVPVEVETTVNVIFAPRR